MQVLCPRINKKQTHSKITSQLSLAEFILIALIYKIFKTIKPSPPPAPNYTAQRSISCILGHKH